MKIPIAFLALLITTTGFAELDLESMRESVVVMQTSEQAIDHSVAKTKKESLKYSKQLKEEIIPYLVSLQNLKEKEQNFSERMHGELVLHALGADVALDNLIAHLENLETENIEDNRTYGFVMKFYAFNSSLARHSFFFQKQHFRALKKHDLYMDLYRSISKMNEAMNSFDTLNRRYSKYLVSTSDVSNQSR